METYGLTILGSFISLLLIVNAYFTRKTLEKLNDVELRLVEYSTRHDATDERSRENTRELERTRDRLHKLEGSVISAIEYFKMLEKKNK